MELKCLKIYIENDKKYFAQNLKILFGSLTLYTFFIDKAIYITAKKFPSVVNPFLQFKSGAPWCTLHFTVVQSNWHNSHLSWPVTYPVTNVTMARLCCLERFSLSVGVDMFRLLSGTKFYRFTTPRPADRTLYEDFLSKSRL